MQTDTPSVNDDGLRVAQDWCITQGPGWTVRRELGQGGTAVVFEVDTPEGPRALKIYNSDFSTGELGKIERRRIQQQVDLCGHDCPWLVQVYDGGSFANRLFLLMSRARGTELGQCLNSVPRNRIRTIVDQIASAVAFLRHHDICHRDIKVENIFISDKFEHATLLDISVIRKIHDPIGVGTDYDGQLPVLATARYSPPEYLFRLKEPGEELWDALTVYQLGALLHDLIMREPLFEAEYHKSSANRYRFAWVVATQIPRIQAPDVDPDLVFVAQRALDKDWRRRCSLKPEDFMARTAIQRRNALRVIGLGPRSDSIETQTRATSLNQVRYVAERIEFNLTNMLRQKGATARHRNTPGQNDLSKILTFEWSVVSDAPDRDDSPVTLDLEICLNELDHYFTASATLSANLDGEVRQVSLPLPPVEDTERAATCLVNHTYSLLDTLALRLTKGTEKDSESN